MRNINLKLFMGIFVAISAIIVLVITRFSDIAVYSIYDWFRLISAVISIDSIIFFIFGRWLWKLKFFHGWLVPFPDLSGTWQGIIQTTWINPETQESPEPIPTMLTISQNFLTISCVMRTGEMMSHSVSEDLNFDPQKQIKQLSYIYLSKTKSDVRDRNPIKYGAIVFDISGEVSKTLSGDYWTDQMTTGRIVLNYYSKKKLDEIPESFGEHPVSGS